MELFSSKQRTIALDNGVTFSSDFESGNLAKAQQKEPNSYHLWVQADPQSTYRTWFYFSVEGVPQGSTASFCLVNMSNQVKLFREGHLPVFKQENDKNWARIRFPLQQNGIAKGEEGFQLTFKHTFANKAKHYFAFTYPWTYSENNILIRSLVEKFNDRYFCDYRRLCLTTKKLELNILTVTRLNQKNAAEIKEFKGLEDFQTFTFKHKKGIFISSRVHPGEVASSHMLNGLLKYLFSRSPEAESLLQNFVFYIVPIVNPDGVIDGNFRCDSLGKNLNRFYTAPSPVEQPQIYSIKAFLLEMIHSKNIHFCLDLHSHVNKQGVFMYGNSTSTLRQQLAVCLYPKLLEYNCKYFDYQSCNFSQKNMTSKDKGDELSKEGASRVAIYKETGLVTCWTLQCNYNSSRTVNIIPKADEEMPNKSVSNGVITEFNSPNKREEVAFLNVEQFEQIGANIAETLLDYYKIRKVAPYFGSKLKNASNFQLSACVNILRMIPFKFDNDCRKIINAINSGQCLNQHFSKILQKIGLDPIAQYLSTKALKQKSASKQKEVKPQVKPQSLKLISSKVNTQGPIVSRQKREVKVKSVAQKQREKVATAKFVILTPNIPNMPKKSKKS